MCKQLNIHNKTDKKKKVEMTRSKAKMLAE